MRHRHIRPSSDSSKIRPYVFDRRHAVSESGLRVYRVCVHVLTYVYIEPRRARKERRRMENARKRERKENTPFHSHFQSYFHFLLVLRASFPLADCIPQVNKSHLKSTIVF